MTNPEKIKTYVDWLIAEIGFQSSYHNHKETMAWVATVFYVPSIIALGLRASNSLTPQLLFVFLLFILPALLAIWFVGSQFCLRSRAADTVAVLMKLISDICHGFCTIPEEKWKIEKGKYWPPFIQKMIGEAKGKGRLDAIKLGTDWVSYAAILIATAIGVCLFVTS